MDGAAEVSCACVGALLVLLATLAALLLIPLLLMNPNADPDNDDGGSPATALSVDATDTEEEDASTVGGGALPIVGCKNPNPLDTGPAAADGAVSSLESPFTDRPPNIVYRGGC